MISNEPISLSKESSIRVNAINTIKYTLLLDYEKPLYDSDESLINNVLHNCEECCKGLFVDKSIIPRNYDEYNDFYYKFFGINSRIHLLDKYAEFSKIGMIPKEFSEDFQNFSKPYLHNFILQHCVMSCYHAICTEIGANIKVTSYSIQKSKYKDMPDSQNKINYETTNFNEKLKTHKNSIPFLSDLSYQQPLTPIWISICNVNVKHFKKVFDTDTTSKRVPSIRHKKTYLKNIISLSDYLSVNEVFGDNWSKAYDMESLYHSYMIERLFDFRLFYSVLNAILYINKNTEYRIDQFHLIQKLMACQMLPNVFSRQALLWYAVLHIDHMTNSRWDFWREQDIYNNDTHSMSFTDRANMEGIVFDLHKWGEQFELFCKYLSSFVIPIYEWCFMGMLFEVIESMPDTDYADNGNHNFIYQKYLAKAKDILKALINDIKNNSDAKTQRTHISEARDFLLDFGIQFNLYREEFNMQQLSDNIRLIDSFIADFDNNHESEILYRHICDVKNILENFINFIGNHKTYKSHLLHLFKAKSLLEDFMKQNLDTFLHPFNIKDFKGISTDSIDIVTPYKKSNDIYDLMYHINEIPTRIFNLIMSSFFDASKHTNLNLSARLNPDDILCGIGDQRDKNRKLYIDFFKNHYFKKW